MTNQEFDDIIKNKAQQRKAQVPEDIWENIVERKKKRRIPFFWWLFLSLLLTGTGIVWITNSRQGKSTTQAEQHNTEVNKPTQQTAYVDKKESSGIKEENSGSITTGLHQIDDSIPMNVTGIKKENSLIKVKPEINTVNADDIAAKLMQNADRSKRTDVKNSGKGGWQQLDNKYSKTGNKTNLVKQRPAKDEAGFTTKTVSVETDDVLANVETNKSVTTNEITTEVTEEEKMNLLPQKTTADASSIKITLSLPADSSDKKQAPVVASLVKKKTSPDKKPGWKIEFAVSQVLPVQQYRQPLVITRLVTQPGLTSEFVSDHISTSVESGIGFSAGLVKPLNKKWSLGAGIQYLQFTELLEFSGVETNSDVTSVRKTKTIIDGRNVYYNFTVPVFVHYSFAQQKKWTAALRAGIYVDISRKYHNDIPGNFENTYASGLPYSVSKNNIGADIFAALHVSGGLSKRYEWFAEPAFRYNLSRYNSNTLSFNKKIHKPTISIGVSYQLRR